MKVKKNFRIFSGILAVVITLTTAMTVMAEDIVWKIPNFSSFIAPRNGNTVTYDASLESGATGEFPYQLTLWDGSAIVQDVAGISFNGTNGTISLGSDFSAFAQYRFRTKIGGAWKILGYYFYPALDIDFQDFEVGTRLEGGVSKFFQTKEHYIKEDAGLHYAAYNEDKYILVKPEGCSSEGKFVIETMMKDGGGSFGIKFEDGAEGEAKATFEDQINKVLNQAGEGWHNYRIIYDLENFTRTTLCDDKILEQNTALSWDAYQAPIKLTQIQSYFDMASFKLYSVPAEDSWAYDIKTDVTPKIDATVTPSASVLDNGNGSEISSFIYQISDNKYSDYVTVGVGENFEIGEEYEGKYFRIGASTENLETGYVGEEVFSEPVKLAPKLEWVKKGGEPYFLIPEEGEVFQYQLEAKGPENITYSLDRTVTGVSVTPDGLLTVLPTATGHGNVVAKDVNDASNFIKNDIYFIKGLDVDFEGDEIGSKNPYFDYGEVKEDENGNKYITNGQGKDYARLKTDSSVNWAIKNMKSTYVVDFDMYVEKNIMKNAYLHFSNSTDGEASVAVIGQYTLNEFYDATTTDYRLPEKFSDGWHNIKIYIDSDNNTYSIIADDDIILSANQKMSNLDESAETVLSRIDFYARIDNLSIRNVTVKTPVAENVTVDNPAVGKVLKADYDFFCGTAFDKCTFTKWYVSDSYSDGYTLVSEENSYTPTEEQLGKFIKAVVTPATETPWGDTLTGAEIESKPKKIVALNVGKMSADLDGTEKDLTKRNFKTATALTGTFTVKAPVTNNTSENKNVLVVTALYSKDVLINVGVDSAEVTAGGTENLASDITFTEYTFTDADKIKILVFDADSLAPIKDVTYTR